MANQYVNKVIIGTEVKLDLTQDDITPDKLAEGIKAHDKSGAPIVGTSTKDADTSDATAVAAEILKDKTAYVAGSKLTGTMPNNGAKHLKITNKDTSLPPESAVFASWKWIRLDPSTLALWLKPIMKA